MCFANDRQWPLTNQLQDAPTGLGRWMKLVVHLLHVAQADGAHDGEGQIS
jgi:hypothetical protein